METTAMQVVLLFAAAFCLGYYGHKRSAHKDEKEAEPVTTYVDEEGRSWVSMTDEQWENSSWNQGGSEVEDQLKLLRYIGG